MYLATKPTVSFALLSLVLNACGNSGSDTALIGDDDTQGSAGEIVVDSSVSSDLSTQNSFGSLGVLNAGPSGVVGGVDNSGVTGGSGAGDTAVDSVSTTTGDPEIVGSAPIAELQGDWTTGCMAVGANEYRRETRIVIGRRMAWNIGLFSDPECVTPSSINIVLTGSTVHTDITTVPTGRSVAATLGQAMAVDFHLEDSIIDNMPLPEGDFFGKELLSERIVYDIILVQDGVLYFGDSTLTGYEGTSPDTRPITLNTLVQYRRAVP